MIRRPPRSTLFPYTTLFRSLPRGQPPGLWKQLSTDHLRLLVGQLRAVLAEQPRLAAADHPVIQGGEDRKSTRLNSSHANISYAVFCLKKKKNSIALLNLATE